jgi:hypothetical protein
MLRYIKFACLLVSGVLLASALLFSPAVYSQGRSKRLILKDGSYQPVVRWEVKGNRVRYLSAERYEWEELPASLVDWPATEKYAKEMEAADAAEQKRVAAEDEAERKAQEIRTPTVAPGIQLPEGGGVYLLDVYQNKPELVELVQSGGEIHKNMGRNILRSVVDPIAISSKQSIEINGTKSKAQAHSLQPAIYVDISEGDTGDDGTVSADAGANKDARKQNAGQQKPLPLAQRFRIIRLEQKKDSRVIGNLKIMFYGKMSQQGNWVSAQVEPVTNEWVKVTPTAPLKPGEYAVAEMLGEKEMNFFVWDFGVDPNAPQNPSAWVPVQTSTTPARTDDKPGLQSRPK